MSNTFEKAPDGPTTEAKKKNVPLSETDNGTVVSAGTVESSDRVTNILQDPDSERLIQALKGDREAKNGTKVEMIAVAPGDEEGFQEWMKKYTTIFTDPNDMEDEETIHEHWKAGLAILYIVEGEMPIENGQVLRKQIGIRLAAVNPRVPDGTYVPYGGVDESYRGTMVYTRAIGHNEPELVKRGISLVFNDCEDETRLEGFRDAYEGKSDKEIAKICKNRLRFFTNNGYRFVDDPDVKYCRPSSEDPTQIQAYDRLGFKIIGNETAYEKYLVRDDSGKATHITKEGYRKMYLSLHTLDQYTDLDEAGLRGQFPAIDKFLTELDASPKNAFPFYVERKDGN